MQWEALSGMVTLQTVEALSGMAAFQTAGTVTRDGFPFTIKCRLPGRIDVRQSRERI